MSHYEIQLALQKLYTAKRRLARMAEADGDEAKAKLHRQQAWGVRDAAIVLLGNDCLIDLSLK